MSVVASDGLLYAGGGVVRLLARAELPDGWNPRTDTTLTVWEATQHLVKRLKKGEQAAAVLLGQLGSLADHARALAYRLFAISDRNGWAEDAKAYNDLVVAWPELVRLSADAPPAVGTQTEIF